MSLKAKIEAVIYAAEEPVTLPQLVSLLGQEAAAELDADAANQAELPLQTPDAPPSSDQPTPKGAGLLEAPNTAPETAIFPTDPAAPSAQPTPSPASYDDQLLQRQARERDRAVRDHLRAQLDLLIRDYRDHDRGLEIREVASGFRLATRPEYHDTVRGFVRSLKPPLKLSLQALETLAVVAYKQPVTAPEVAEIRGVDSAGVLGSLAGRKLITTAGRKQVVGRPILYKTTKEFLLRFGLRDLNELPSIEEFERLAGDLADTEPHQEQMPMSPEQTPAAIEHANLQEETLATEPQADGSGVTEAEVSTPVDGRISGPPPAEVPPIDSPAGDAALQADQDAAENGTED